MALGLIGSQTHRHTIRLVQAGVFKKRVIIRLEGNTISKHQSKISFSWWFKLTPLPPHPHHTPRIRMSGPPQQRQSLGSVFMGNQDGSWCGSPGWLWSWLAKGLCTLPQLLPLTCTTHASAAGTAKASRLGTTADGSNLLHSLCLVFKNTDPCSR